MGIDRTKRAALLASAVIGVVVAGGNGGAFAAAANWSGGGNANNSGSWTDPANWTGGTGTGGLPGASDAANLVNVTTGTRTVTVASTPSDVPNSLNFTQTTAGAVNRLLINPGVTLSAKAFGAATNAAAGVGSVVTDVNGTLAITATNNLYTPNLANTVNFGAGGGVVITALSAPTVTATGALTVGVGVGVGNAATISTPTNASSLTFSLLSGATLDVTSGQFAVTGTAVNGGPSLTYASTGGSATTIAGGATLAVLAPTGTGNKNVNVSNGGSLAHAGTLSVRPSGGSANASAVTNTGTWTVRGAAAQIVQQAGAGTVPAIQFTNAATGTLTGAGTLTLSNLNANNPPRTITNHGTIDPGASGVGGLSIVGANVAFGAAAGTLRLDATGAAAGQYDTLAIGGALDLTGSGHVLDLVLGGGFAPTSGFVLEDFATYSSLTGAFEQFLVNGAAAPAGWSLDVVNNGASADLVVTVATAVPEPAALGLLASVAFFGLSRRRARRVSFQQYRQ